MKSKLAHPAPAKDLYTSALFRGARRAVEASCTRWFILSAKHGLLEPDEVVAPYDETLKNQPRRQRRAWSQRVLKQLREELGDLNSFAFEVHAGRDYSAHGLVDGLRAAGAEVVIEAEGLTLGQRLAYYSGASSTAAKPARGTSARSERRSTRHAAAPSIDAPRGKYRPLYEHLRSLGQDRWDATFRGIEDILGDRLPASARAHPPWWANEREGNHSQARAWLAAGFETRTVRLDSEQVSFHRTR